MEQKKQLSQEDILNTLFAAAEETPEMEISIPRLNNLTFTLKALRDGEIERVQKRHMKVVNARTNEKELDKDAYYRALIVAATVAIGGNPAIKWNHEQLLARWNAADAENVVKRVFLAGEIVMIVDKILKLSGHYDTAEELNNLGEDSPNVD